MKYLGVLLLVLSGNVMAEEVYYCSDIHANGFNKKDGQYKAANYRPEKFKMKLQDDGNIAIENPDRKSGKDLYHCSTPFEGLLPKHKNNKSCVRESNNGWLFNFNLDNGRYIWFKGGGYVFNNGDSVITMIGTCTKF